MRVLDNKITLSPTDLMRFQDCAHATALDLKAVQREGTEIVKTAPDAGTELIWAKGDAHEQAYLQSLKANGLSVLEVDKVNLSFHQALEKTRAFLLTGPDVIYQAALFSAPCGGYADFLERVEVPSNLGPFSYEILDTKLKQRPDPKHVLQLCLYSDLLAELQGLSPSHAHLVLGTGERVSLRLSAYQSYARHIRSRLQSFVSNPWSTRPEPVETCDLCSWRDHCAAQWAAEDNLCLVAGITRAQRRKLEALGVWTMLGLSDSKTRVPRVAAETLAKLKVQAKLQVARRKGAEPHVELRPIELGRGLTRLPEPATGDLFFDMEGDPYVLGGLEYLFGVLWVDREKEKIRPVWAHDADAERQAAADILAFFATHLARHPGAHIYHYNHYEVTALKRLTSRHGIGEEILDKLLRRQCFVDLYRIVQQGLIASEAGYSLKDLEVFYMPPRSGEVASAADSMVAYEKWRESHEAAILKEIQAYNEIDCRSTKGLRDWLVKSVRPKEMPWYVSPKLDDGSIDAAIAATEHPERVELRASIDRKRDILGDPVANLLFEICWFHRREAKPQWWAMFDRADRESSELIDDLESLGGMTVTGQSRQAARSTVQRYNYPEQETKLRPGSSVKLHGNLATVTLTDLDPEAREADVKFGPKFATPPDTICLIPGGPLDTKVLQVAVQRFVANMIEGTHRYDALEELVFRRTPRIKGRITNKDLIDETANLVSETCRVVGNMDRACLPIQGPPGTGKTYVSSRAIVALLKTGKRVGISCNSHKAIDNLLSAIVQCASEVGYEINAIRKISTEDQDPGIPGVEVTTKNDDSRLFEYQLVGGTAWMFAREEHDQEFDYLFVDEAGQVSLANILAIGTAAKNLVLVGDPMQLAQPIQGVHPGDTGLSGLEYLLDGNATVPPDRGIFLPVSRRLSAPICRYISDLIYDGRLTSDAGAKAQHLILDGSHADLPAAGLCFNEIGHVGNSQFSDEEVDAIDNTFRRLLKAKFSDRDGNVRLLALEDILVVSPYNAQVNHLKAKLPSGARVGTVDKFQGQEAPVCLISMATSSGDDLPRDIEFLFSKNRLNVAISRAQALSVVFASPRLLDVKCQTLEQVRLVNCLCAVKEYSAPRGSKAAE